LFLIIFFVIGMVALIPLTKKSVAQKNSEAV